MNDNNPFKILNQEDNSIKEINPADMTGETVGRIKNIIASDKIVLFMKGNASFPQCGFSANTVAILKHLGQKFSTFDILKDMDIRQGLKEYSNWPTFPQLYVNGQLIGGNDIVTEMFEDGELQTLLNN
jgi:monothiol glutaredoxin